MIDEDFEEGEEQNNNYDNNQAIFPVSKQDNNYHNSDSTIKQEEREEVSKAGGVTSNYVEPTDYNRNTIDINDVKEPNNKNSNTIKKI